MSFPRIIRNFNGFIDGTSYFGRLTKGKTPALKLQTEAHRGAGMDAPVSQDMGMELLQTELTFAEVIGGVVEMFGTTQTIVLRPVARSENPQDVDGWIFTMRGLFTSSDIGEFESGKQSDFTVMSDLVMFRAELNGKELFKIDVENGVRVIGGVDQMAAIRTAMGI